MIDLRRASDHFASDPHRVSSVPVLLLGEAGKDRKGDAKYGGNDRQAVASLVMRASVDVMSIYRHAARGINVDVGKHGLISNLRTLPFGYNVLRQSCQCTQHDLVEPY